MDRKTNPHRTHKLDTQGARWLVMTVAVASTMGFWAIFSKVNHDQTAAAANNSQSSGDIPPSQADNELVLDLPPLPTLIPPLDPSMNNLPVASKALQNPVNLSQPVVPMTGKIFLGGSKPGLVVPAVPRAKPPITHTGSSK